jgi:hypothetical protein
LDWHRAPIARPSLSMHRDVRRRGRAR